MCFRGKLWGLGNEVFQVETSGLANEDRLVTVENEEEVVKEVWSLSKVLEFTISLFQSDIVDLGFQALSQHVDDKSSHIHLGLPCCLRSHLSRAPPQHRKERKAVWARKKKKNFSLRGWGKDQTSRKLRDFYMGARGFSLGGVPTLQKFPWYEEKGCFSKVFAEA